MRKDESPLNYFTPKEAAPRLTVSYWTVLRMIEDGELRAIRVRKRYRITQEEIDRIMGRRK